jgi:hypothetical protein
MQITFDHEILTSIPPTALWELLVQAFRNSDESPLWPHALERVRSNQVAQGALVRATYHLPLGPGSEVTYRFAQVQPGRMLRYASEPGHPMRGGGTVQVLPAAGGSLLRWTGGYDLSWRPRSLLAAAFTRFYFEQRFFAALEANLRGLEQEPREAS